MNQAQRRRLPTSWLLLLLLAGTPLVSLAAPGPTATASTTASFAITGLSSGSVVQLGVPVTVTVSAMTSSSQASVDTTYAGTIEITSTDPRVQVLPTTRYTFNPSVDRGTKAFTVTFLSLGQWELRVQDLGDSTLNAQIPNVVVTPGPPVRFKVALDAATIAGNPYTAVVTAVDQADNPTPYTGSVSFATTVLRAQLPLETSVTEQLVMRFSVSFLSADPNPKTLTVTGKDGTQSISGVASTVVRAGTFDHVALSTAAPDATPACADTTLVLTAEDALGNPVTTVPSSATVSVCDTSGSSATFVDTDLGNKGYADKCVTGNLAGTSHVIWNDPKPEAVEFTATVSGYSARKSLLVHFTTGIPSRDKSSFSFGDGTQATAPLFLRAGQLIAQLNVRDQCENPATLPPDKVLSFAADTPLAVTSPVEDTPGHWTTSVSLPECPADASKTLAIWPRINGEPLSTTEGKRVQLYIQPRCSTIATLSVLTSADSLVAEPGDLVEFEVRVSTEEDVTMTGAVLMLEPQGLTVIGASSGGQALPARGDGFELPELRKDSPLTIKVTAQTTTLLQQTVSTKVWVVNPEGTQLTPAERVDVQRKAGVDVGCGCQTAALPGQLIAWLALLLVASRPWGGLRRLRRGERNDP